MLELHKIRSEAEAIIARLNKRGGDYTASITEVVQLDEERRNTQQTLDTKLAEANKQAAKIGQLFKEGKKDEANTLREQTSEMKAANKELEHQLNELEEKLQQKLYAIPNAPQDSVPAGNSEEDNEVVQEAEAFNFSEDLVPHWELTEKHNLIDFELGVKITGAGFPLYLGKGAKLQRALIQFFLDEAEKAGYTEVQVPLLINEASGYGTGQLPDKDGQMYHTAADDLYLIPTAEIPITNIFRDEIIAEDQLPLKRMGYTPCFRREAGSYGKDVRGLNRLHQFDKVEIVQVANPAESNELLEEMKAHVEGLLKKLELPYRILRLCGGDLGTAAAVTYDFEVYAAGQKRWLEVSSVSNFETYQANRLKLRLKNIEGKKELAHTLNGSALALPRIVAALLENGQNKNGGVELPASLHNYLGFSKID